MIVENESVDLVVSIPIPKKIRYMFEYVALSFALLIFDALPLKIAESIALFFANQYYRFNKKRRSIALANIKRSGIATDPIEIERIARESFRNFGLVAVESLKFCKYITSDNWHDRVEVDVDKDVLDILTKDDQGIILVSAHLGNWEVAGKILSFLKPVSAIARKMNNPYTNRIMDNRNSGNRVKLIPKRGAGALTFLREIRRGNALTLLVDQHARRGGIMVNFFGTLASTYPTPAFLHLRTKAPLIFGYCVRIAPMRYKVSAVDLSNLNVTGDRDKDVKTIVETLNRALEKGIKKNPGQYLWAHRRWRD